MALWSLETDHHLGKQISVGTGELEQPLINSNSGLIKPLVSLALSTLQNSKNV